MNHHVKAQQRWEKEKYLVKRDMQEQWNLYEIKKEGLLLVICIFFLWVYIW